MRHQHLPCLIEIKAGVRLSQITHLHSPELMTLDYYTSQESTKLIIHRVADILWSLHSRVLGSSCEMDVEVSQ